ncbi:hypothetical protein [Parapedobacter sp.]
MSEREEHNELIHRLAERLRNHSEPYRQGAWERFAAAYVKRRRRLWPYTSAAAVLLAAVGWYWSTRYVGERPRSLQLSNQEVVTQPSDSVLQEGPLLGRVRAEVTKDGPVVSPVRTAATESHPRRDAVQLADLPVAVRKEAAVSGSGVDHREGGHTEADGPAVLVATTVDTATVAESEPHRLAAAIEEKVSDARAEPNRGAFPESGNEMEKWDFGLMVSPSLTSEAVNIGGGFAIAYRISDKFSIGSGISVAQLGIGENPDRPSHPEVAFDSPSPNDYFNGQSGLAVNYKKEVSITSSVVTLDIPLDLRYEVAHGFYTSVGVSYVAVLDERRTGHYIDRLNKNTFANGRLSTADRLASTEFVYSSEEIADKPLQGNGYAGFMNFSIGKKLPISSKLFLSVEPYFKLPIGRLSNEEMNFTNGGIRIVTGF